ncbi:hypothetical protein [Streptococcus suis]|uniref:hypothetical protein n=1 Tax=Streptococcus suis TaxID=1307 RepID=UPI0039089823
MEELQKKFFGGYTKESVQRVLESQAKAFEKKITTLEVQNAEMKQLLEHYREREAYVTEALTEAKQRATEIVTETESQAKEKIQKADKDLQRRLKQVEQQFDDFEEMRRSIIAHEEFMKVELRQLLKRHMELIEAIDLTDFYTANTKVKDLLMQSQLEIKETYAMTEGYGQEKIDVPDSSKVVPIYSVVGEM